MQCFVRWAMFPTTFIRTIFCVISRAVMQTALRQTRKSWISIFAAPVSAAACLPSRSPARTRVRAPSVRVPAQLLCWNRFKRDWLAQASGIRCARFMRFYSKSICNISSKPARKRSKKKNAWPRCRSMRRFGICSWHYWISSAKFWAISKSGAQVSYVFWKKACAAPPSVLYPARQIKA
ncbi:hypothetical protein SDC9_147518 [bioreactor metagenome]|uniref:Uncharacterized protein n=1 Tax=bioreactor metagenome TaxID=1076179 RepID=A0A645EHU6_9ZZZZ